MNTQCYIDQQNEKQENCSWASLIENELSGSISDQVLKGSTSQDLNKNVCLEENLSLGEMMSLDFKSLSIRKIIEYQNIMANNLKKYIKQCMENNENLDLNLHMSKFEWLSNINNYLSKKLKLPNIPIKNSNSENIARSSYKFCEYSYDCEFNYPKNIKKIRGCYKQHFVYNFLKADIDSIILYLKKVNSDNITINYEQLNICMNTMCFVINKMKDEIENLYSRYKENYEKYHQERSINLNNKKSVPN